MKPKRFKKSQASPDQLPDAATAPGTPARPNPASAPSQRKPESAIRSSVEVAELSDDEIRRGWDGSLYVPPMDDDPFVRAQKIVIAYSLFYAPTIDKSRYTQRYAYRKARQIARPIAAFGAGIPLDFGHMAEYAFAIYDAILSWAAVDDHAVRAIARIFAAYAIPRGEYSQVVVSRAR
jgi:hypothetical protein